MNDQAFLAAFENGTLHPFQHRDHIRIAWLYLRRDGWEKGYEHIGKGIRHFAATHGATRKYHETITRFWATAVYQALCDSGDDFSTFEAHHPYLFDKDYIRQYYSVILLSAEKARQEWVEPDLKSLDKQF